jgi:hypothetical protein
MAFLHYRNKIKQDGDLTPRPCILTGVRQFIAITLYPCAPIRQLDCSIHEVTMTREFLASPISRLVGVLSLLPVIAIVALGFYSSRHYGTDGIVGVLLGVVGLAYFVLPGLGLDAADNVRPSRRFILDHRRGLVVMCFASIALGLLGMCKLL